MPRPSIKPRLATSKLCISLICLLAATATFLIFRASPKKNTVSDVLHFPENFMWGTATASYQIEGSVNANRVPSIWDRFTTTPGNIKNNDTGEIACDHYNRFKEDVQLMRKLNISHYRFSIAWPRIHTFADPAEPRPNPPGIDFYNKLIDELIRNGITPVVTLYHWDLPTFVQDSTGGWGGDGSVVDRFEQYANLCFESFGDRVKQWITLNEPWCSAVLGYDLGVHAPGDTSNPGEKLYIAGHNLLRAHARAVNIYRERFQEKQKGKIGITLNSNWAEPKDPEDPRAKRAAQREMDFWLGWYADPIWKGDYPQVMKDTLKDRLPSFTEEEKKLLKGSSDFFGLNHYSSHYISELEVPDNTDSPYWQDKGTVASHDKSWKKTDMDWSIVPWGFRKLLVYIQDQYNPKGGIIVTENGLASSEPTRRAMQEDTLRIEYLTGYIKALHEAIEEGADVKGYFLWSLMDNFEWAEGFSKRFGLYYVDYQTMERIPKPAANWYTRVASTNSLEVEK